MCSSDLSTSVSTSSTTTDVQPTTESSESSESREADDAAAMEGLTKVVLNWDVHDSYEAARTALITTYGVDPDSELLTKTMPPDPVNTDSDGNRYSYIDASGLNTRSGRMTTHLLSESGSERHYETLVQVTSITSSGRRSSPRLVAVTATLTGAGDGLHMSEIAVDFTPAVD